MKKENLVGMKFNRLLVISYDYIKFKGVRKVNCLCDCGNIIRANAYSIKTGNTKSCGCLNIESIVKRNTKHGMEGTKEYRTWKNMKTRCFDSSNHAYKNYGGRGITVCDRWKDSFENFYADMGERPEGQSIDRIDNNKGYSPENCRWATTKEQSQNKRTNVMITFNEKTQCLTAWAADLQISIKCLRSRLYRSKWSIEKSLTTPLKQIKVTQCTF
jgi:hypothetical protein